MAEEHGSAPLSMPDYADVVDLGRYPICDLASPRGEALVARCRSELSELGACTLPGFCKPEAVEAMVALGLRLSDEAFVSDQVHTVYFLPPDPSVAGGDARAKLVRSAKRGIAYDRLPADAPMRRLYESDDMTRFVAAALDKPVLHRSADPLDALQITLFYEGDELGWHFDNSEFSVTVMYQPAEAGGDFDYVAGLRSADGENYAGVSRVLAGDLGRVRRLPAEPGMLALFRGRHALHRVTPIEGGTPRVNSVLTYGERPDMRLDDLTSMLFYGRVSPPP